MAKHHLFRSGIVTWAKVISRELDLNIVFKGDQPCTDGRTIHVFGLPDIIDVPTEMAIIGAIDHEALHVETKNGSFIRTDKYRAKMEEITKKYGDLASFTHNVFEDMRIETNGLQRFPGAMPYFEAVREWLLDHNDHADDPMENTASAALIGIAYLRFPKLFEKKVLPRMSEELKQLVALWSPYVQRSCEAKDVWEIFDITEEFLKNLKEMARQPSGGDGDCKGIDSQMPFVDGNSDGKGKQKNKGKQGSGKGKGKNKYNSPAGGKSAKKDKSDTSPDGDESQKDDDGEGNGGNLGGDREPDVTDAPIERVADFDWEKVYKQYPMLRNNNPEADHVPKKEIARNLRDTARRVIHASEEDTFKMPDFGGGALEGLHADFQSQSVEDSDEDDAPYTISEGAVRVVIASPSSDSLANQVRDQARGLYPIVRQRMRALLLAKRANKHQSEKWEGEVDPGIIYSLAVRDGARNVFSQLTRGRDIDTSALMLIDGSGSMSGNKAQVVMRCAYFFSDCLEKCAVPTEVAVFQNSRHSEAHVDYSVVKAFNERVAQSWRRFVPLASGGTPMADAMLEAVNRLSVRREDRKILFVLTDGEPDIGKKFMVRLADAALEMFKIETIGLGVDTDSSVGQCFKDFVMLDSGSLRDVETNFIGLLQKKVLAFR